MIKAKIDLDNFHYRLRMWYDGHQRDLPWRKNANWYTVWISEIMLQQTQVQQVIPYFLRFIETFPNVKKLAAARLPKVLKIWEGLGYYSRARNLLQAAKIIQQRYKGHLPAEIKTLSTLPGFGTYTSHAVLSIAFNQPLAAVDGNVLRLISRLFKIRNDIRLAKTRRKIQQITDQILDKTCPGLFNQAMMEVGATVCLPSRPQCDSCPLRILCQAWQAGIVEKYPYKSKSAPKPVLTKVVFLTNCKNKFLLVQRPAQGLLAGMWEFPCFTFPVFSADQQFNWKNFVKKKLGLSAKLIKSLPGIKHSYTHFNARLNPWLILTTRTEIKSADYKNYRWIPWSALNKLPVHRAMRKLILNLEPGSVTVSER
jgi:A/G-specific adenine glycosylase